MASGTIKNTHINTHYSFNGEVDSYGRILTNLPLDGYVPINIVPYTNSRAGWFYSFKYDSNVSTNYWVVRPYATDSSEVSGTFSADIIALPY